MTQPFAICTLAFGDAYIKQMNRLKESIRVIYPEVEIFSWVNSLPEGAKPHKQSPYGFKVHAVNEARAQGYDKIIWADTALVLRQPVDYWFNLLPFYGIIAAKDDNKLDGKIGDAALRYYGNPNIDGWHLVGGSLFVFDFSTEYCNTIFSHWEKAEKAGMFRGEAKHRNDESCMSMALYLNGSEPTPYDVCRYNDVPDPIVQKFHFK